jgi:dTDP-4-dehydrorhamnose 3,5-epimerase
MGSELIDSVTNIEGLSITPLSIIDTFSGDVMHAMKKGDDGYVDFGEAYFSKVEYKSVKAWKRHRKMVLNLVVPVGKIRFVIYDDRQNPSTLGVFQKITLSNNYYARLTVPPLVWIGFQGLEQGLNLLLNIASIPHDPNEFDRKLFNEIDYDWSLN